MGHQLRQRDRTANIFFSAPDLIAFRSRIRTLGPGDVIFTRTPGGVGIPTRRYLTDGDVVTTRIDGLGELRGPAEWMILLSSMIASFGCWACLTYCRTDGLVGVLPAHSPLVQHSPSCGRVGLRGQEARSSEAHAVGT